MRFKSESDTPSKSPLKNIVLLVVTVVGLILASTFIKVSTIEGNQLGVLETWSDGVKAEPLTPKTYWFFPGFTNSIYKYDMGIQVYAMNDIDTSEEIAEGRKIDAYVVQSADQQDMRISFRIRWRRIPAKLVEMHKSVRDNVEERILRTSLLEIVKNHATTKTALEAYSGETLVALQKEISEALQKSAELNEFIHVESFVIEHIGLDPKYTAEIVARQVAVQERLKNLEQTKAAEAAADKAKALAQADYEKTLVEARRDKERGILAAEQAAQQQILAAGAAAKRVVLKAEADAQQVALTAEAEKNRNVLIAQGERDAGLNRAEAIRAIGAAEADALKLKLGAYATVGSDGYVKIQVAQSMAEAFKNINGYLPQDMSVNLLAEQYSKGVNLLVGQPK